MKLRGQERSPPILRGPDVRPLVGVDSDRDPVAVTTVHENVFAESAFLCEVGTEACCDLVKREVGPLAVQLSEPKRLEQLVNEETTGLKRPYGEPPWLTEYEADVAVPAAEVRSVAPGEADRVSLSVFDDELGEHVCPKRPVEFLG